MESDNRCSSDRWKLTNREKPKNSTVPLIPQNVRWTCSTDFWTQRLQSLAAIHQWLNSLSDLSSLISGARGRLQSVRCSEGGAPTADLFRKQYLSNPVKHGRSWAERWLESQGRWTAQVNNLERHAAAADDQCGRPGGAMTDRSKEMRGDQVVPWAGQLVWRHFEDSQQSSVEIIRYRSVRFLSFQKHW